MANYFAHFSSLLDVGISETALAAHKSIGSTSTQEWMVPVLCGENPHA
jgi:hypothetical protein